VRRSRAPVADARVLILGPGIRAVVRTGPDGRARATLAASRAGVLRVRLATELACPPREVSILPGVTG
jgi:hypothetical protein